MGERRRRQALGGGDPEWMDEQTSGGDGPRALAERIVTEGRRSGLQWSGTVVTDDGDVHDVDELRHTDPRKEAARIRRGPFDK